MLVSHLYKMCEQKKGTGTILWSQTLVYFTKSVREQNSSFMREEQRMIQLMLPETN